ncbi:MAG: Uma2 family endonuclease [Deltaproteobacteria bacterium]
MRHMHASAPYVEDDIVYPSSDGKPMAEGGAQYEWLVTIQGNLDAMLEDFVGADMFWYPVRGDPKLCMAPDVFVVLGRPKAIRPSYIQWMEGGVAPQVVFEIISPSNTTAELIRKLRFYEQYGVEELYYYDPERETLSGWVREGERFVDVDAMDGFVSPRLRIRFELKETLRIFGPDGAAFKTFAEQIDARRQAEARADAAEEHAGAAEARADAAEEHAGAAEARAAAAEARAAALEARLAALDAEP